jgi:hypothetical protein
MKKILVVVILLLCFTQAFSQLGIPRNVEFALGRIEQAFRSGYPGSIEDMLQSGITMRLDDSLYQSISSIYALDLLKKFFTDKDSIDFRFGLPGSGTMYYTTNGKRDTMQVDVWLRRNRGEVLIHAINISNYPIATVFFDIHKNEK